MHNAVVPHVVPRAMPLYDEVMAHARAEYPREACGLFVERKGTGELVYLPCRNVAHDAAARDEFVMDPRDWARAEDEGRVVAVVHSHPDESAQPSGRDRAACRDSGLTWYVVAVPDGAVVRIDPHAALPLVGRAFEHGSVDCYTLVRDYYRDALGLDLPQFERSDGWWERGEDLYATNFAACGFIDVGAQASPQEHDAILMRVRSRVANHAAVYVGGGIILHHLYGRLSCRDVWGGYWQRAATHVLRHSSLIDAGQQALDDAIAATRSAQEARS